MDEKELDARIAAANDKFVTDEPDENEGAQGGALLQGGMLSSMPTDIAVLMDRQRMVEGNTPRPRGARAKVSAEIDIIINKRLKRAYNIARETVEALLNNGDTARARMAQDQYMNEKFLPVLEAMTHTVPSDELLNASGALEKLDKYVLTQGGSPAGFSRAFIKQLYAMDMGRTETMSDNFIAESVERLKKLVGSNQIRAAVGLATKMLGLINKGQHMASKDDYELIMKIAERGM